MFIYKDNQHQTIGPVSADEIRRLILDGSLSRHSLVSDESGGFWQPAYRFEEFADLFTPANSADGKTDGSDNVVDVESTLETEASEEPRPDQSATPPKDAEQTGSSTRADAPGYFLIGGDGREYGPITADQLRAWIRQHRADQHSRARRADDTEWTTLGNLEEFNDAFSEHTRRQKENPPPLDAAKADALAEEILRTGYNLNISSCFSRSWKLYTENFLLLTGITALDILIVAALNSVAGAGNVVSAALVGVLSGGLAHAYLKLIRGGQATVSDTFDGFQVCFVPLMLASVLTHIGVSIGLMLCLLPGIYLFVAWLLVYPIVRDLRLDFWPAMELSRKVIHERWWEWFAFVVVLTVLNAVGAMFLGIGFFLTAPFSLGAILYAYEDIFRQHAGKTETPPAGAQ